MMDAQCKSLLLPDDHTCKLHTSILTVIRPQNIAKKDTLLKGIAGRQIKHIE